MNLLRKITAGITDDNVYKRIGWMYVSFFIRTCSFLNRDAAGIAA